MNTHVAIMESIGRLSLALLGIAQYR